jgi:hypothetical protein
VAERERERDSYSSLFLFKIKALISLIKYRTCYPKIEPLGN